MKRTTLFLRSSLILTLTLFSSFDLSYASGHLEDEEVQPQSLSKAVTIHSQEPLASYGDFDQLSEDLLFHQILPHCDQKIIQVNRSFFTLVTGYTSDGIFDQGFDHLPARQGCRIISYAMIDFKKQSNKIQHLSSFVWYCLMRSVTNISSDHWPYLKGSQVQTVNLMCNQIGADSVRDFGQSLKDTQVQTVYLSRNQIGADGARDFGQSLQDTQVHTVDLSYNQISDEGAKALGQVLKRTQIQTLYLPRNDITLDMQATLRQMLSGINLIF